MKNYNPENYWEKRLTNGFNLSKVGHLGFSEHYNKFLYKAKTRTLKKALSFYQIDISNKTVCDIGCGTGFFVDFYKHLGARDIAGIDITNISVENLKLKYPEYNFIRSDISSSLLEAIPKRKFDILNVFDVLYHIKDNNAFRYAIINISNLTQKGGFILISDMYGTKNIEPAEHVKFRSKKIYKEILTENGIEVIAILPLYYLLNRPIFGKIYHSCIKIDNLFAPIYYYFDSFLLSYMKNTKNNLNLIISRKIKL